MNIDLSPVTRMLDKHLPSKFLKCAFTVFLLCIVLTETQAEGQRPSATSEVEVVLLEIERLLDAGKQQEAARALDRVKSRAENSSDSLRAEFYRLQTVRYANGRTILIDRNRGVLAFVFTILLIGLVSMGVAAYLVIRQQNQRHQLRELEVRRNVEKEERNRIARELHDSAGANLAAIRQNLLTLAEAFPATSALKVLIKYMEYAQRDIRGISHRMYMADLEETAFPEAIQDYANRIRQTYGIDIDLICSPTEESAWEAISLDTRHHVYRMIQETVSNAIRHADASFIDVQVILKDGRAELIVEDDGKGFDPAVLRSGLGMESLQDRARSIGAEFYVDSGENRGTFIQVSIPQT